MNLLRCALRGLDRCIGLVAFAGTAMSCLVLMGMVVIILIDIVMRAAIGRNIDFASELVGYGLAAIIFGTLTHALRRNDLIRVTLFSAILRRYPLADRIAYCLVLLITLPLLALPAWQFWKSILRNWSHGTVSPSSAEVPIWLPESLVFAGIALFVLQILLQLLNQFLGNTDVGGVTLAHAEGGRQDVVGVH